MKKGIEMNAKQSEEHTLQTADSMGESIPGSRSAEEIKSTDSYGLGANEPAVTGPEAISGTGEPARPTKSTFLEETNRFVEPVPTTPPSVELYERAQVRVRHFRIKKIEE